MQVREYDLCFEHVFGRSRIACESCQLAGVFRHRLGYPRDNLRAIARSGFAVGRGRRGGHDRLRGGGRICSRAIIPWLGHPQGGSAVGRWLGLFGFGVCLPVLPPDPNRHGNHEDEDHPYEAARSAGAWQAVFLAPSHRVRFLEGRV
jgi:hypothetical protein